MWGNIEKERKICYQGHLALLVKIMLCLLIAVILMLDFMKHWFTGKWRETHLQRQHFLIDAIKCYHSKCPWQQTSHIPTDFFCTFKSVIIHIKIRLQKLNSLFINSVLGELLKAPQESRGTHQLKNRTQPASSGREIYFLPELMCASK